MQGDSQVNGINGHHAPVLTMDNVNPRVREMQYAVRGPIVVRATEIEKELKEGVKKPFARVMKANIGDCHATGQIPNTFLRQVIALCSYPPLFESPDFPEDAKSRARRILDGCRGSSVGSYSASAGIDPIREDIANYISKRDGIPSKAEDVILCTGASDGIKTILSMLMTGKDGKDRAGIMIPVPQYPLYSATLTEYNAYPIRYYLNEEKNWSLDLDELKRALNSCRGECVPRAICVINPGNPTGQVLTKQNIQDIIRFASDENLMILADEVYQHNIYAKGSAFFSFKKVLTEMGPPYSQVELASFMSASKGYLGECGFRGGYFEVINMLPDVKACLLKSISAKLCPPILGQAVMSVVSNFPTLNEPSGALYAKEKEEVLAGLARKARMVTDLFNSIDGIKCNEVQGAMYSFPRLFLPDKAVEEAKARGQTPDSFYCFQLLEETGICTVPGSGFGEKEGTYHLRMTILPPEGEIKDVLGLFKEFHMKFLKKYQ
ncbi:alanine aminotransferase 2-like [Ylistrum balloti]|uniref:alanine aminotransferase 2-like n=1 Tax=Ylistrum balloti TaxID=509963 RepID=UPI002905B556|nr:alanine aminotransferase 2-like [Ylistrum balloti]